MIGTWVWNGIVGGIVAALIFLLSFSNNPMDTALLRSGISFAIGFIVTFIVRWLIGQALLSADPASQSNRSPSTQETSKGRSIDLVTPDELSGADPEFAPLAPPKLATKDSDALDPELLAKAIRQMSES